MPQQQRRSRLISGLLALGLLAGAALTAHPAQAADSSSDPDVSSPVPLAAGLGPYYALPSWDRKMGVVNRFVVLTDWGSRAVLDKETGLVWERSPSTANFTWDQARSHCTQDTTTGNRKGWRLPSVHELASLVDPSVAAPGPTLPPGHPFTTGSTAPSVEFPADYFSASLDGDNEPTPTYAWFVGFNDGYVGDDAAKTTPIHVWCVRGGMNAGGY